MVELISAQNLHEANEYLTRYEETAQFLINNLKTHGPVMTDHHNSGHFKLIRKSGRVAGVFCLTRRGNLLIQTDTNDSTEPSVLLDACAGEPVSIKGFIGDWNSIDPVYRLFLERNPSFKPSYEAKEILYSYTLSSHDSKLVHDTQVRLLQLCDFDQWLALSAAYMLELSIPDELTLKQKERDFEFQVVNQLCWGLFVDPKLLSKASLNSKGQTIGQVGGVYTPPEFRKKGFAKRVMFHMLKDCIDLHSHTKNILFTGETDLPAQRLYESMGYKPIGFFALVLSS